MNEVSTFRRRTFLLEMARALPSGAIETAVTTFAVLLAVRVFEAPWIAKATLVALPPLGMILSLFVVQVLRRTGTSMNVACATVWLLSAAGFAFAARSQGSLSLYLIGLAPALTGVSLTAPLVSQIYRKHYPGEKRGSLFATTGVIGKIAAILTAYIFGVLLQRDLAHYPILLWVYAACAVGMALLILRIEAVTPRRSCTIRLFDAWSHVRHDHRFRLLLKSWMLLGLGNLLCMALFVEYISSPRYGWELPETTVSLLTTMIPGAVFLLSVIGWGRLFDRANFYRLRAVINILFIGGILTYFLAPGLSGLAVGIGLHGVATAGGYVAWNLWVTKFAPADHVAEYMSVHTFATGLRGVTAPFVAFPLAAHLGPTLVAWLGAGLIGLGTAYLIPRLREETPESG